MLTRVLVIHGAGMNMRGKTNIDKFGPLTLAQYNKRIEGYAAKLGAQVKFFQSNVEGEIINELYGAYEANEYSSILINPAGFTLGYRALSNAIKEVNERIPVYEIHISNPMVRGVVSDMAKSCTGIIHGFGITGYHLGLLAAVENAKEKNPS